MDFTLRRCRGAIGRYQAAPGAPLAAARVPRRPWTAPTTIPGAGKGLNIFTCTYMTHATSRYRHTLYTVLTTCTVYDGLSNRTEPRSKASEAKHAAAHSNSPSLASLSESPQPAQNAHCTAAHRSLAPLTPQTAALCKSCIPLLFTLQRSKCPISKFQHRVEHV